VKPTLRFDLANPAHHDTQAKHYARLAREQEEAARHAFRRMEKDAHLKHTAAFIHYSEMSNRHAYAGQCLRALIDSLQK
jgi:hypothetical protein